MLKSIKYAGFRDDGALCSENGADCETRAGLHVCFEDGSGAYLCQKCFHGRLNRGDWSTDSAVMLTP